MRTICKTAYSYDELSDKAKEHALWQFQSNGDYPWGSENEAVLDWIKDNFPVKVRSWEYGGYRNDHISWDSTLEDEANELTGPRLMAYVWNNHEHDLFKGRYYSLFSKKDPNPKNPNQGKLKTRYSKVLLEENCPT